MLPLEEAQSGSEVRKIQTKLKQWGYYKGSVDECLWK